MRKRLFKVLSVPVAIFVLMIPMIIIQSGVWVINGKKTPNKVIDEYFDWLENG